ncbi:carboxypeptidase-like regulatory domain-containing protein [Litoribacter populi]|uniref:carboxypeptidase-like regulatory domain-containing protein n=1 Tax=Litoribacter populi TaxID=2598460 RepID=UPI00117F0EAC|nr:carboxypeptidase-like regulatory domain-containing protein [Litoribacter populi]
MYQVCLAFLLLGSFLPQESFIWKGTVVDGATGKPIAGVHVLTHNRQGISDKDGRFEIEVKVGDKITFTHVSYDTHIMVVEEVMAAKVELNLAESELEEFILHSMPSEEQLKQQILNTPYIPTQLESNLTNNLGFVKNIYQLGNHHTQNSIDNAIRNLRGGNGEATIFSTNPSMGIIGFIRSLKRSGAIPMDKSSNYGYPFDIKRLRKSANDTTLRYSDYFDN